MFAFCKRYCLSLGLTWLMAAYITWITPADSFRWWHPLGLFVLLTGYGIVRSIETVDDMMEPTEYYDRTLFHAILSRTFYGLLVTMRAWNLIMFVRTDGQLENITNESGQWEIPTEIALGRKNLK